MFGSFLAQLAYFADVRRARLKERSKSKNSDDVELSGVSTVQSLQNLAGFQSSVRLRPANGFFSAHHSFRMRDVSIFCTFNIRRL